MGNINNKLLTWNYILIGALIVSLMVIIYLSSSKSTNTIYKTDTQVINDTTYITTKGTTVYRIDSTNIFHYVLDTTIDSTILRDTVIFNLDIDTLRSYAFEEVSDSISIWDTLLVKGELIDFRRAYEIEHRNTNSVVIKKPTFLDKNRLYIGASSEIYGTLTFSTQKYAISYGYNPLSQRHQVGLGINIFSLFRKKRQ
jgi:hypothetical protein